MASKKLGRDEILATFYDEGVYTSLFAESAVSAAFGSANGQPVYAIFQNGNAVSAKDMKIAVKAMEMAAATGNPVVTFYDSIGATLEDGLTLLKANAELQAEISKISGVVPQIAVVIGVCGASASLAAASADLCIMAEGAELFLTAPFTSAAQGDKVADAGTAACAAKAGVAAIVAANVQEAVEKAVHLVGLMPANNLTGPAAFAFEAPSAALNLAKYEADKAVAALADAGSVLEMYPGYGKNVCAAMATVNGSAVGFIATAPGVLCHNCSTKIARFVRLCDAFSIPVVTLVNTDGFAQSVTDDVAGGIRNAARVASTYADATTAKVAVVTGKAVGAAYSALTCADLKIAVDGCVISPVEPKVAVSVLYKEKLDASDNLIKATETLSAQFAKECCSAQAALESGCADLSVDAAGVRQALTASLEMLATKRTRRLAKKHGNMSL